MASSELPQDTGQMSHETGAASGTHKAEQHGKKKFFTDLVFNLFDLPRLIFLIRSHLRNMLQPC